MVKVWWADAFDGPQGWVHMESYSPTAVLPFTVGFLLENFLTDYVTVCSSYFYDDNDELVISNPVHIPSGMVKEVTPFVH